MICEKCDNEVSRYQITQIKKDEHIIDTYYGCSNCNHRWEEHTNKLIDDLIPMENKND